MRILGLLLFSFCMIGCSQRHNAIRMSTETFLRMAGPGGLELSNEMCMIGPGFTGFELDSERLAVEGHWYFYSLLISRFNDGLSSPEEIQVLFEYALYCGDYESADVYYRKGATADIVVTYDNEGQSIFRLSREVGRFRREIPTSLLALSIQLGLDELTDFLLNRFLASPTFSPSDVTPLWCAVRRKDKTAYWMLRKRNVDPEHEDYNAFMASICELDYDLEIVQNFLDLGYDPNQCEILIGAVHLEDKTLVQMLLNYGATPEKNIFSSYTALDMAKHIKNQEILDMLLSTQKKQEDVGK